MKLEALTDTGCDGLVIHTKYRSLAKNLCYSDIHLAFADGSISPACEQGTFNITITDSAGTKRNFKLTILIADIDYDLILGMRWLATNNCLLDAKTKHVTFREINSTKDSQGENRNKISRICAKPECRLAGKRLELDELETEHEDSDCESELDSSELKLRVTELDCETKSEHETKLDIQRRLEQTRNITTRWERRRHEPMLPTKNSSTMSFCSIRQLNKLARNKRTRFFLARNVTRLSTAEVVDLHDSLDLPNPKEKENPIDDFQSEDNLEKRLDEKFKDYPDHESERYKELLRKYSKTVPGKLPDINELQDTVMHDIDLISGSRPKNQPIYHCSEEELLEMKRQITELLTAGHIRHSNAPWASSILFVKKKGTSKLRMCIDYRYLNSQTIKDATPIARIDELRQRLKGSTKFSALDLLSGYYQIKIDPNSVPKTAFNCRYGHFEWLVMPFGLTNAPATFSRWINTILGDLLDKCVVAYLDDILIYSKSDEAHLKDLDTVLSRLQDAGAILNLTKSHFGQSRVEFLGHIVDSEGVSISSDNVKSVTTWPQITDKSDLASFCGMINYFKNWIDGYANIMEPLNYLRKKDVPFSWTPREQSAMIVLQYKLISAPVLVYFDPEATTVVYTDASAYAIGGWLGQHGSDKFDQPILYYSRKLKVAETRYGTHERELLAIVEMLRVGRPYLEGRSFVVKTDHEALKWLNKQPHLSRRQATWIEKIQSYDMLIEYQPGKFNYVADALSRRPDYFPNCPRCHLKLSQASNDAGVSPDKIHNINSIVLELSNNLLPEIKRHFTEDERKQIVDFISNNRPNKPSWKLVDGIPYFGNRLFIPTALRKDIIYTLHDINNLHPGTRKTIDLVQKDFYWPNIGKDVKSWIQTCDLCQRKTKNRQNAFLQPFNIPRQRFTDLAMDHFEPPYQSTSSFNSVLLVIDRLRKYLILIAAKKEDTAEDTAKRFIDSVIRNQGVPQNLTVDRDKIWTSQFWKTLADQLNISMKYTTARHQQANGLAESSVKIVKQLLNVVLNEKSIDWTEALPIVQLVYNNTPHTVTGFSPFELTYGQDVNSLILPTTTSDHVPAVKEITTQIKKITELAIKNIQHAQKQQASYYNRSRRNIKFEVGDLVLLERTGINVGDRYTLPFIGPFPILDKDENNNYRLQLPPTFKIHDYFHSSKLARYCPPTNQLQKQKVQPQPEFVGDDNSEPEYEVQRIVKHRFRGGQKQYLTHWKGYDSSARTWENSTVLNKNAKDIVRQYELTLQK